ncbi:MAG: gliding motility-associated C-terminal domain-containing protein [Bacteroidales bacterium]|nr:gliding motility-associated C-terminal domain-containing protein [Bacteroidales bacterium]
MRYTKNVFVLFVILLGWSRLFAQTYHLGDIYEAPDGSQGIVYYLNPDGSGGLVVALHDASAGCSWGELVDIPSLQSYIRSDSYNTPVHVLMTDTSGYTNTIIIRAFQNNNPSFAAGVVDIANGWVLPSLEQLAKLFGQLPFISAALVNAGGEEPAYSRYWCSAECDSTRAWVVNFENSYSAGNFLAMNKANIYRVRAVRSFSYKEPQPELSYTWSTGDTTTSITVTPDQTTTYTLIATTSGGCADTVEHTVVVNSVEPQTFYDEVCQGEPYFGNGFVVTMAETSELGLVSRTRAEEVNGCETTYTLELTVNASPYIDIEETACDSYEWNGQLLTSSGDYTVSYLYLGGCDSTVTLHLTVNYGTHNVETETACDSYQWHGMTCDTSGTHIYEYVNEAGCLSADTLHLTVIPLPTLSHTPDTTIIAGTSAELWAAGAEVLYWTDGNGNILASGPSLTVTPATSTRYYLAGQNYSAAVGNNLVVNGDFEQGNVSFGSAYNYIASTTYMLEGYYSVGPNARNFHTGFYNWPDHTTGTGNYMIINGAETPNTNVWTQTVAVTPNTDYSFSTWVCSVGGGYQQPEELAQLQFSVNGSQLGDIFTAPDAYGVWNHYYEVWNSGDNTSAVITILNQNTAAGGNDFGIDDIVFAPLVDCSVTDSILVTVSYNAADERTICDSELPYEWNGVIFEHADTVEVVLEASSGADSVVTLHLTVNYVSDSTINVSVMEDALPYILNGESYDTSGTYYQTLTNASGCDSLLTIVLSVITTFLPDNVDSANCVFFPDGTEWWIQTAWQSENIVSVLNTPLVGDLDGDGIPEIVCFARDGDNSTGDPRCNNHLLVFDGRSKAIKASIILPSYVSGFDAAAYGLVRLPNGPGLIVVACFDYKLRAYDISAANPSVPYWVSDIDFGESGHDWAVNVSFADFNHDGLPEVYVRNKIYNAETGTLLVTANTTTHYGASYAHWTNTGAHPYKLSSPIAADVCGDVKLDLILGNEVYDVNINNLAGTLGNSITLAQRVTPPGDAPEDGHPQVADFNHDGYLDVFVSVRNTYESVGYVYGYVWDIHNQTVSAPFVIRTGWSGKSIPLIADIDNDNLMEVLIQSEVSWDPDKFQAYKYHPDTRTFTLEWGFPTDENSYSNSITAFDFNQDGLLELMISDQNTMRIVNGSGISHITHADTIPMYVLNSFPFSQNTIMQYPVIADVDADGSAEIVSVGSDRLNILKSSTSVPWAPARKVWNQYMYNVTNVNEDLTIPQYLFNNATAFTDPEGVVRRPFNNFLQQGTTIDQYGRPFYAVPDVAVNQTASVQSHGDSVLLSFSYCNIGDNTLNAPYTITIFANTYGGDTVCTVTMNESLPVDSCTQGEIRVSVGSLCSFQSLDILVIAVNGNGGGIAQNGDLQPECDTTNNVVTIAFSLHADTTYVTETACDIFDWYEHVGITQSGDYTHVFTDAAGCDSVVILHLTVFHSTHHVLDTTVCESFTWDESDGASYTVTGTYTYDYTNTEGCASVDTLHLTILHGTHHVLDTTVCESYTWTEGDGVTYTASGTYTYEYTNIEGCASTDTLRLTVNYGTHHVTDTTVCESYTWTEGDGATYTVSGTYTYNYTNADGCASTDTLYLTIVRSENMAFRVDTCDLYIWYGIAYTESGLYTCNLECHRVDTLYLHLNYSVTSRDTLVLVENQLPYYFAPADTTIGSGAPVEFQFSYSLPSASACDSTIMQTVIIHYNTSQTIDTTVCAASLPYNWHNYQITQAGSFNDTVLNENGSDHLITLQLNVSNPAVTEMGTNQVACYGGTDGNANVVVTGGVQPYSYQWTNAAGAAVSASAQLASQPAGTYYLHVTDALGCQLTDSVTLIHLSDSMVAGTIPATQSVCSGQNLTVVTGTAASGGASSTYQWQISSNGANWNVAPVPNNSQNYNYPNEVISSFFLRRAWVSQACGTVYSNVMSVSVLPIYADTLQDAVCQGYPYQNNGFDISEAETADATVIVRTRQLQSSQGCDSSVTLLLTVIAPQHTTIADGICQHSSYQANGFDIAGDQLATAGEYTFEQQYVVDNCDSVVTLHLTVYQEYEVTLQAVICEGDGYDQQGFIVLAAQTVGVGELDLTRVLQSQHTCDSVVNLHLTVMDTSIAIVSLTEDFCEEYFADLSVVTEATNYEWSTGETSPVITVTQPGMYMVTATQDNCSISAWYQIQQCEFNVYLPNAITPGLGDGLNDYFCIHDQYKPMIEDFEIHIYSRWGELVYYSKDKDFRWEGVRNPHTGEILRNDIYTYLINFTDKRGVPHQLKGNITVL